MAVRQVQAGCLLLPRSRHSRQLSVMERHAAMLPAPRDRGCGTRYKHVHVRSTPRKAAPTIHGRRRSHTPCPAPPAAPATSKSGSFDPLNLVGPANFMLGSFVHPGLRGPTNIKKSSSAPSENNLRSGNGKAGGDRAGKTPSGSSRAMDGPRRAHMDVLVAYPEGVFPGLAPASKGTAFTTQAPNWKYSND